MKVVAIVLMALMVVSWRPADVGALPRIIRIGAILDQEDDMQELAMRHAVERVNGDKDMLPRSTLDATIDLQPADDSFHASKRVCHLLAEGVAAIFGPQSENTANHVQSICDNKAIPHIETRYDYKLTRDAYSINLHPYPPSLSKAYFDILKELKWKSFVVLYDSNESLVRLQSLLQDDSFKILVRQLYRNTDHRPLLKQIRRSTETRIVIDVRQDMIYDVLKQAMQVGLMNEYYSYFITSLDFNQIHLEEFRPGGANITGIQLVDPNSKKVQDLVNKMRITEQSKGRMLPPRFNKITTGAALIFDAVVLFASALTTLEKSSDVTIERLYCDLDGAWKHGTSFINFMKVYGPRSPMNASYTMYPVMVEGLTGLLRFDTAGFRSDFTLDIIEMDINNSPRPLKTVGKWTLDGSANFTRTWSYEPDPHDGILQNRTLIVSVAVTAPYIALKSSTRQLTGNDRYEGFCIDIIKEIAELRGFNYTFIVSPNNAYGSKDTKTGEWNGIVRELMDHRADLGIVDFTITYEREEAVDFTMPFMNLGISIIYSKPSKKAPSLFSFMSPFSVDVWIYMATAYLGVSVLLFILARMAPEEWDCPYPCIEDPDELENCFTLLNSMWFIIGTFLCQGADIAPKAVSTRIVAGIWWFFTLIMISSYTANLAAFLTVERMDAPIESAEDLAKQTKIKYGCKKDGSTYKFFQHSNIPTYMRMWSTMSNTRPPVFTETNDDGVQRVAKSKGMYAFLMESSSIEYEVERKCDLMQIGGLLDSKSYGIALPQGSPYTGQISSAILHMKEKGTLHNLKEKWWKAPEGSCQVVEKKDAASAAELGLKNVGGVFVVMVGGIMLAVLVACCEFMWKARKLATDDGVSFTEEICKELIFVISCRENSKPVRKKASPSHTDSSSIYDFSNYGYSDKK